MAYGKATDTVINLAKDYPILSQGIYNLFISRMASPFIVTEGGVFIRDPEGDVIGAAAVAEEAREMGEMLAHSGVKAAGLYPDAG